jgi:mRNA-degrading endonuclease YafQ of YafQ-DinJ toxin-antitoxin module
VPKLVYTHGYIRRAKRFFRRHPELISQYEKTLRLLEINPSHPSLRLHSLGGKLQGLYSVSINMTYRVSLEFTIQEDSIVLVNVGSHDDIYRT